MNSINATCKNQPFQIFRKKRSHSEFPPNDFFGFYEKLEVECNAYKEF